MDKPPHHEASGWAGRPRQASRHQHRFERSRRFVEHPDIAIDRLVGVLVGDDQIGWAQVVDDDAVGANQASGRGGDQHAFKSAGLGVELANGIVEFVANIKRVVVGRAIGAAAATGPQRRQQNGRHNQRRGSD